MANAKKIGGLGKGLQALIPERPEDDPALYAEGGEQWVQIEQISPNPYQPRRSFDEEKLQELAESIKEHGVIQPVLVRAVEGGYQLIAGERRMRAALIAGLAEIPALVREMTEREMTEVSLIENVQRQDLDPVEEARAYRRLSQEFGLTQEQIAKSVSKSRPYIANSMRLLQLPEPILEHLAAGALSVGHARPLLMLSAEDAIRLAERLIEEGATVRDAERWTKELAEGREGGPEAEGAEPEKPDGATELPEDKPVRQLPVELKEIQRILRDAVNTKVEITYGAKGGKITIDYYTQDDIERILEMFTGSREVS